VADNSDASSDARPSWLDKSEPVLASKTAVAGPGMGKTPGLVEPGNIDLTTRPDVANADGTHSSVRSMSFSDGGPEILIPTVPDDGSHIMSDDEAIAQYRKTGKHLGKFTNPQFADEYASRLHRQQAAAGPHGSAAQVPGSHPDDDELLAAAKAAPVAHDDDAALLAAGGSAPAPKDDRGFFARAKDTLVGGARAVGSVASDLVHHPIDTLSDPAKRRQLERGVDDVATLGYGQRLASRIGEALGDKPIGEVNPEKPAEVSLSGSAPADETAHPEYRAAGSALGMVLPNPGSVAAREVTKLGVPVAKAIAPGTEKLLSRLAATRVVGPVAAPLAGAAAGIGRGVAGYEATAPALAALSANAAGHRLEAGEAAATDPAGLVTSGAMGAVAPTLEAAGKAGRGFVENATKAADEYIPKDIVGESKGASTPVARAQMARAAKDFPDLIGRDPELRTAIAEARSNDLPKVKAAVDLMQDRLRATQAEKPELYKTIDAALPDSGIKMKDVVKAFKDDIHEWEHGEHGGEEYAQQIAQKLKQRLATITGSEAYGAKPIVKLSAADQSALGELQAIRAKARGPAAAELDKQIAAIQDRGTPVHEFDPEAVVSTRQLRRLATDAQNTAFMGEGGLNGTERYKRALDVASTPTKLLDESLERARGAAPEAVQRLETMDRDTHALLAAKAVMDQRLGTATANSAGAGGAPAHAAHSVAQLARGVGGMGGAALLAGTGHYVPAALMAGGAALPVVQRAITERAARMGAAPGYAAAVDRLARAARGVSSAADFVRQAVPAGISAIDARAIWRAAHPDAQEVQP
jgi:hypothetical protein